MCSLSWKNVVVVIAVLTLQIAYLNGVKKDDCKFERFKEDQGNDCCFYEPECEEEWQNVTTWIDIWKPYKETIWKCRNFTRPIEECELGPNITTCTWSQKKICTSQILPGKCAKVTHLKPETCVHHCAPEYPLFDPIIHAKCKIPAGVEWKPEPVPIQVDGFDLRRAGREFIPRPPGPIPVNPGTPSGHDKPHGHPGIPGPVLAGPPIVPGPQPAPPPTIPPGCHESCQYESYTKCCDFPDKKCDLVWIDECTTGPEMTCKWVDHETCSFYQEKITKYKKIPCEDIIHTTVDVCNPWWWCKVCEGKPDLKCYRSEKDYPTTPTTPTGGGHKTPHGH